ncbi:hypothetical protein [Candidatus Lokiarchaeum ossiferum]|uniref:hypothetical protein n=1 Tax=Candidatus Lokiarchaeum ossiferum TaxID=2951803 RepID=UPI00352BFCC5
MANNIDANPTKNISPYPTYCDIECSSVDDHGEYIDAHLKFRFYPVEDGEKQLYLFTLNSLIRELDGNIQKILHNAKVQVDFLSNPEPETCEDCQLVTPEDVISDFAARMKQKDKIIFPVKIPREFLPYLSSLATFKNISTTDALNMMNEQMLTELQQKLDAVLPFS